MFNELFNILELKKLYPKSIEELEKYLNNKNININSVDYLLLLRFFDSHFLYIGISADSSGKYWYVDISETQVDCLDTRDEAEILAITECFEILEKQIYG